MPAYLTVFTKPGCGFCHRLLQEESKLQEVATKAGAELVVINRPSDFVNEADLKHGDSTRRFKSDVFGSIPGMPAIMLTSGQTWSPSRPETDQYFVKDVVKVFDGQVNGGALIINATIARSAVNIEAWLQGSQTNSGRGRSMTCDLRRRNPGSLF